MEEGNEKEKKSFIPHIDNRSGNSVCVCLSPSSHYIGRTFSWPENASDFRRALERVSLSLSRPYNDERGLFSAALFSNTCSITSKFGSRRRDLPFWVVHLQSERAFPLRVPMARRSSKSPFTFSGRHLKTAGRECVIMAAARLHEIHTKVLCSVEDHISNLTSQP